MPFKQLELKQWLHYVCLDENFGEYMKIGANSAKI